MCYFETPSLSSTKSGKVFKPKLKSGNPLSPRSFIRSFTTTRLLTIIAFACSCCFQATAIDLGPLEYLDPSMIARKAVDDLADKAQEIIQEAESAGNALIANVGDEINLAVTNIRYGVGDDIDKQVKDIAPVYRQMLSQYFDFTNKIDDAFLKTRDLMDSGTIDLQGLLQSIPGIKAENFLIQRITGLSQIIRKNDFTFKVMGFGFGAADTQIKPDFKGLFISGRQVPCDISVGEEARTSEFTIKQSDLQGFLPSGKGQTIVPAVLEIEITKPKGLLQFWGWPDHRESYKVPLSLHLFPPYAGTVTLSGSYDRNDWIADEMGKQWAWGTGDRNHKPAVPETHQGSVDIHHLLRNPRFGAEGDMRVFSDWPWKVEERTTPAYLKDNDTTIYYTENVWGPPFTFILIADVYKWGVAETKTFTQTQDLEFGSLATFTIPKALQAWQLRGRTLDDKPIAVVSGAPQSDELQFLPEVTQDEQVMLSFKVKLPTGLGE